MEETQKPQPPKSNKKTIIIVLLILAIPALLILCIALIAALFFVVAPTTTTTSTGGTEPEVVEEQYIGEVTNDTPVCSLPIINYDESAFQIGVPNGWIYEVNEGTVSIMQDDSNTTAAFLYTAKLNQSLSSEEFLDLFGQIFSKTITDVGGTFSLSEKESDTETSSGLITAALDGVDMTGKMLVEKTQDFVTLRSYWAPIQSYDQEESTLEEIANCFGRQRIITDEMLTAVENKDVPKEDTAPTGFDVYKGRYFQLNKPTNFKVTAETDSGIDLTRADNNAGFSYAYVTGAAGSYTPQTWAQKALPQYAGIQQLQLSAGRNIPSPINGQTVSEFDFTGSLNGFIPVNGKVTVGIITTPYYGFGTQYFSAFWGIQIATPEQWPQSKDTLQTIQDSLQIIDIGATRKNTLLPPNRPIESVGGSSITSKSSSYSDELDKSSEEKWSDAMRGYETVSSPSTGDTYDVPLNSWSSYGPDGPGYYRQLPDDSLEKLN